MRIADAGRPEDEPGDPPAANVPHGDLQAEGGLIVMPVEPKTDVIEMLLVFVTELYPKG